MAITEQELFAEAVSDAPPVESPAPAEQAPAPAQESVEPEAQGGPVRDPATGKFTAKTASEQPSTAAQVPEQQPAQPDHRVPLTELLSEREKRQAIERERMEERRQMAALQARLEELTKPKVEPPDPYADPAAFLEHGVRERINPIQQQADQRFHAISKLIATEKHGEERVTQALQALNQAVSSDPRAQFEYQRIMASDHPYGELVNWHQRQSVLQEIGTDPAAYKAKLRAELQSDPEFIKSVIAAAQQQAQGIAPQPNGQARPNTIVSLPSLNSATGRGSVAVQHEESDAELFKSMAGRR